MQPLCYRQKKRKRKKVSVFFPSVSLEVLLSSFSALIQASTTNFFSCMSQESIDMDRSIQATGLGSLSQSEAQESQTDPSPCTATEGLHYPVAGPSGGADAYLYGPIQAGG